MKILFVANNVDKGGIQTSLINLLKFLSEDKKNEIDIFVFSHMNIRDIPDSVKILKKSYFLNLVGTSFKNIIKTKNIIKILLRLVLTILIRLIGDEKFYAIFFSKLKINKRYDYAISYFNDIPESNFNKGATLYVLNYVNANKKLGWIHTDIENAGFNIEYYKKIYDRFDYVINVSKACKKNYDRLIPTQKDKSFVIYNYFPIKEIKEKALKQQNIIRKTKDHINLVTVARIDNCSKRIDFIIKIAEKLIKENTKRFKWYIIGDGPDFNKIKKMIKEKKLEKKVFLLGNKDNPYPYIKEADLFVLTSKYEGYPMVIGESMILDTPVLVTKYMAATEQIKNNENGIILDDDKVVEKLKELILDTNKINLMRENIARKPIDNTNAINQIKKVIR